MDDLLEAMIRTMNQEETVGPVNIGNPNEFTIRELAEAVMKKVQSNASLIEMPLPEDDPTQRKPDITLAQKVLGWNPEIQLEEGLDRTIPYFQELLGV
jgi:UDP-glucuronate decarboxylase